MAGNENSGRPSNAEIIRKYVDIELANKIANKELKRIDEKDRVDIEELRTVVMPIALKGIIERKDITTAGKPLPLLGGQSNVSNNSSDQETTETP